MLAFPHVLKRICLLSTVASGLVSAACAQSSGPPAPARDASVDAPGADGSPTREASVDHKAPDGHTAPDGHMGPDGHMAPDGHTDGSLAFGDAGLPPNPTLTPLPNALPDGSVFTPPPANACDSAYDYFYGTEPGVYAYWALCEPPSTPGFFDYVGPFDLTPSSGAFGGGTITQGVTGPVPDGETAAQITSVAAKIESQDLPLNAKEGTLAVWLNAAPTQYAATTLGLSAVGTGVKSAVSISVVQDTAGGSGDLCVAANFTDTTGAATAVSQCGVSANAWHRAVMTWKGGTLSLYVDGSAPSASKSFGGTLDNVVFYYQLFPGSFGTGGQMTLAKALVANQAWDAAGVLADTKPAFIVPPDGGVLVTATALGTVHRDVLGYADINTDLSSAGVLDPFVSAMGTAGVTAVRYASGYGGITAGVTAPNMNVATQNNLDNFMSRVASPLGLHVGYTVNYGTNPSACNAGGSPTANGADLVHYANVEKHYGIKYWEIGNEEYSGNSETDFHPGAYTGASYNNYEPAFYADMKAQDGTIQIGIPVTGTSDYAYDSVWTLPVLAGASYDDVVFHNYPMNDPISDGDTLYQDRVSSNMARLRGQLLALQTELLNDGKSPDSIWVTEWDGNVSGDLWSQQSLGAVSPLFATVQLAEYMRAGVQYATWWAQGASATCLIYNLDYSGSNTYSWYGCGGSLLTYTGPATGLLPGELMTGMKPGDLMPVARAFQMLSASGFVTEGEHMLETVTDTHGSPWLLSYAATHGGSYALILINRDRDTSHTVPVKFTGVAAGGNVLQWTYGRAQYDQTYFGNWEIAPFRYEQPAWADHFDATLAPWSVNVFVFGS
jgi:hypothetical protein